MIALAAAMLSLHLIPAPSSMQQRDCGGFAFARPLRVAANFDPGARAELNERWRALGLPGVASSSTPDVVVRIIGGAPQSYRLDVGEGGRVRIDAADADGAFYAAMTLAQLPARSGGAWRLPCVRIADKPALRWRILSDDVSRGPIPNMRYFKERIRTIAAFKMNGYSPYMEHVFVAPQDPLPAPLDGITPAQLGELDRYARRFHVAFIPQQQTFAHMHNTLRYEQYAPAAEMPHGFLLSPASALSVPYITRVVRDELEAVPHPPFFHIGSDETSTLGLGQSKAMVKQQGLTAVYSAHIRAMYEVVKPSGARIMLWDDGIENDPAIMKLIPRNAVVVNWHYGAEKTFQPYIDLIAKGGFDQMVDPGDSNWNQIFPNVDVALTAERRFIDEGKRSHVFGMYQSVWNDDGETLFEATWYPVLYSAADAWEERSVDPARFEADFSHAFFGAGDPRYGQDVMRLAAIETRASGMYDYNSDYLMWADPFNAFASAHMAKIDLRAMRLDAEAVQTHLLTHTPPLHANAARVMFLAARKFDFIGRKFQAAREVSAMYAPGVRPLLWSKYWFWELRDGYEELAPLYAAAWRYEDRESHLASNLERYHLAAQRNIVRADRVNDAMLQYDRDKTIPAFDTIVK